MKTTTALMIAYIVCYVIFYLASRYLVARKEKWTVSDRSITLTIGLVWPLSLLYFLLVYIFHSIHNDNEAKW